MTIIFTLDGRRNSVLRLTTLGLMAYFWLFISVMSAGVPDGVFKLNKDGIPIQIEQEIKKIKEVEIDFDIKPNYILADFDGDGKPDSAVWIRRNDGKKGLWIHLSSQKKPLVFGCGIAKNPWDNWVFDSWTLLRPWQPIAEPSPLRDSPPAPKLKGDYLMLLAKDSGVVILYWNGERMCVYTGE